MGNWVEGDFAVRGNQSVSGALSIGGEELNATPDQLDDIQLTVQFANAGTAGSVYVVCPQAGTITGLAAVNHAASTTTKTVLTAKIAGTAVTHPAWEIAATATAGTAVAVSPTATNAVTAGQVIEIASDGGTDATMPVTITLTLTR